MRSRAARRLIPSADFGWYLFRRKIAPPSGRGNGGGFLGIRTVGEESFASGTQASGRKNEDSRAETANAPCIGAANGLSYRKVNGLSDSRREVGARQRAAQSPLTDPKD